MFQSYFRQLQKDYLADPESSELTFRTYFQNLLNDFAKSNINRELVIKHEPTNQDGKGRPDFKVTTKEQLTIGLIETKKIGENLPKHFNSKQLANYKQLSDNIIVTDYLNFYLIKNGEPVFDTALFSDYNLQNKKFHVEQTRIDELSRLFKLFFESEPEPIYKAQDLAIKLSDKAIFLKEFAFENLQKETGDENLLHGLFKGFQESIIHQITEKDFADVYSQTITYSLFLAALNCDDPKTELYIDTAYRKLPNSFPLIRELFHRLDDFPTEIVWAIDEIISILKVTDVSAIKHEFADYRHKEKGFNDPFIYFYEDFLKHFDKSKRELRGVYYTPEPVVSFIVRSIESILKDQFGIQDGFVSKEVTLLDFAAGTGTFLLNCFKQAIEQAQKLGDRHTVNKILNEQVINNFYGFELLVAPYVIAHLKISEYLKDQGYSIQEGKRLNIFLTDTLSKDEPKSIPGLPSISKEGKLANETKAKPILVILGNPPYSGHSANKNSGIDEALKDYYQVDGKPLGEKNPKWLQDDYVKFIRFAQWKMEKVERGVIGVITNHSYLDNPTFRGMRQSLMNTFDQIYILDLHGNAKKKEKCPDGSKDENVFDIQQGVSIAFFIKTGNPITERKIFHFDLYGLRQFKYDTLLNLNINTTLWQEIKPSLPFYLFKQREEYLLSEYNKGKSLNEIFNKFSVGIVTSRDEFVTDIRFEALKKRMEKYKDDSISDFELASLYNLKNNSNFSINKSRKKIRSLTSKDFDSKVNRINYRPFDFRYIFYDDSVIERSRKDIMVNMLNNINVAICIGRQWSSVGSNEFDVVTISNQIVDFNIFRRGGENIYPLYIEEQTFFGYVEPDNTSNLFEGTNKPKTDNFTKEFKQFIKSKYKADYTPEQILGYIYAVLHSPAYRTKYIEFLKIDFPRIPFTDNEDLFLELSKAGFELIEHHLLKKSYEANICHVNGTGDNFKVEKVEYKSGKVYINPDRCFEPISEQVWNFFIGGYQVLEKWLKERKKHEITLSGEDIQHFIKVVNVLDYTIQAMERINELTESWM